MPIRPELRHHYAGPAWRAIRARILPRAGNCCERCGVPNRRVVLRAMGWWTPATLEATVHTQGGAINGNSIIELPWRCAGIVEPHVACFPARECQRWVGIVLTIAHLDNDPANNDDANLQALCRGATLKQDVRFH